MITFRVDGKLISVNDKKEAIGACFALMDNINYWSYEALRDLYKGTMQYFSDIYNYDSLKGKEKAAATRFQKYITNSIRYIPKDRNKLIALIYETILSCEKMGRLRRFGIGNQFGDSLKGNAEVTRISKARI